MAYGRGRYALRTTQYATKMKRKTDKTKVCIFVGTRKGGFIFTSDKARKEWKVTGPHFKSWNVMHLNLDRRDGRLHAAVMHDAYGPTTHYSDDLGKTWVQAKEPPAFTRPSASGKPPANPFEVLDPESAKGKEEKVIKVWNITPGRENEPNVLYAGIDSDGSSNAWQGSIDDVRIYNYARTPEQIMADYNGGFNIYFR